MALPLTDLATETTHRRTATVPDPLAAVRVHDALAAMPDVRFSMTSETGGPVEFTVECGRAHLGDVAAVFRELAGLDAHA